MSQKQHEQLVEDFQPEISRDQVRTPPSLLKWCHTPEYPISPPRWEKSTFFSSIKEQRPLIFLFIEGRQNQLRQSPPSLVLA